MYMDDIKLLTKNKKERIGNPNTGLVLGLLSGYRDKISNRKMSQRKNYQIKKN